MNRNIKNRKYMLAIFFGLLITLFISGLIVMNYIDLRDALVSSEQEHLETIASNAAKAMEVYVDSEKKALEIMVSDNDFNHLIYNNTLLENNILELFFKAQSPKYETIELFDQEGRLAYVYPKEYGTVVNTEAINTSIEDEKSSLISDFENVENKPTLRLTQPFYEGDQILGVVRVTFNINYMYESFIQPIKIHNKGYASVKNDELIFIMHPREDQIGKNVIEERISEYPQYDWSDFIKLMNSQKSGGSGAAIYHSVWVTDDEPHRVKKFNGYSSANIGDDYWIVTVSSDYDEVTSVIKKNYYSTIGMAVGILVLLLSMLGFLIYSRENQKKLALQIALTDKLTKANEALEEDIIHRKRLEKDLLRSQRKYKGLFQTGSDCVFVVNLNDNFHVEEINDKAHQSLGYSKGHLQKKTFMDISLLSSTDLTEIVLQSIEGSNVLVNTKVLTLTQEEIPVELSARVVKLENSEKMIIFARNITERLKTEEAMKRSEERFLSIIESLSDEMKGNEIIDDSLSNRMGVSVKLEEINLKLERLFKRELDSRREKEALMIEQSRSAAMGEMINNIAYQWRQPLNVLSLIISNFEEQIEEDEMDKETVLDLVDKSYTIIDKMSATIDDFRDFLKPNTENEVFNVYEIVQTTYGLCSERLKYHGIKFSISGNEDLEVSGFSNQFMQVMLNLINNSVDAILEQDDDKKVIEVNVYMEENYVKTTIGDSGGGIDESLKDKIFDPYFTTKEESNGTGIGLYMSKMIMEKHFGGSIALVSMNDGTVFELKIPINRI